MTWLRAQRLAATLREDEWKPSKMQGTRVRATPYSGAMATTPPPGVGLTTEVDRELAGLRDRVQAGEIGRRKSGLRGTLDEAADDASPSGVEWRHFQRRHREWMGPYWEECRAFYAGGPVLLRDRQLLKRVFPPHTAESELIYQERCKRAFYFAYAGTIIDNLLGGLLEDPVTVTPQGTGDRAQDDRAELDPDLQAFLEDVSPTGGQRLTMQRLLIDALREALLTRRSWVLLDLPQTPEEYIGADSPIQSRLDQEQAGLLDPYAVPIEAEYVTNWQDDTNGLLEWAIVCDSELRQDAFNADPYIRKTFTIYDREGWHRYRIDYLPDKPPKPTDLVPLLDAGKHTFQAVPLVRIELPEGLWAMGKLESLAREHFNKRAAVAWAEYKSLFAVLYEFLAPEEGSAMQPMVSQAQQDPARGVNQVRGQGYSQIRGHEDDARFVGPEVAPFAEGRESCADIMREMHRVLFSMSLSANMDRAALQRSGESKQSDDAKIAVILAALGHYMREALKDILALWQVAKGRPLAVRVGGAEEFVAQDVRHAIETAVTLMNGVPMRSPTFKKAFLLKLYKLVLGEELTQQEWAEVRQELESAINAETELLEDPLMTAMRALGTEEEGDSDDDGNPDDEDDDEDDDEPPGRRRGRRRPMFSTKTRR